MHVRVEGGAGSRYTVLIWNFQVGTHLALYLAFFSLYVYVHVNVTSSLKSVSFEALL